MNFYDEANDLIEIGNCVELYLGDVLDRSRMEHDEIDFEILSKYFLMNNIILDPSEISKEIMIENDIICIIVDLQEYHDELGVAQIAHVVNIKCKKEYLIYCENIILNNDIDINNYMSDFIKKDEFQL